MTVLVARKIFAPMTWDGGSAETDLGIEYDIAGAMLMPREQVTEMRPVSLEDIKHASDEFKVTASAMTVRAIRLGLISQETGASHLNELRTEYFSQPAEQRPQPHPARERGTQIWRARTQQEDAPGTRFFEHLPGRVLPRCLPESPASEPDRRSQEGCRMS